MAAVMPPATLPDLDDDLETDDPLGYIPCSECWYCEQITQRELEDGDYDRGHCECRASAECALLPYDVFDDWDM